MLSNTASTSFQFALYSYDHLKPPTHKSLLTPTGVGIHLQWQEVKALVSVRSRTLILRLLVNKELIMLLFLQFLVVAYLMAKSRA